MDLNLCPTCPLAPAKERAARAIAFDPGASDRALGKVAGVAHITIARARKTTGTHVPVRKGRDGKNRKLPAKRAKKPSKLGGQLYTFWGKFKRSLNSEIKRLSAEDSQALAALLSQVSGDCQALMGRLP